MRGGSEWLKIAASFGISSAESSDSAVFVV